MRRIFAGIVVIALLSIGPAWGQGVKPVRPPSWPVYTDTNGTIVGLPAGGSLEAPQLVYRLSGGDLIVLTLQPFSLAVTENRLRWYRSLVWYEKPDCTGQAFVTPWNLHGGRRLAVIEFTTNHLLVSVPDPVPDPAPPPMQSIQNDDGLCTNGANPDGPLVAVSPYADMGDLYKEPFRLEAKRLPSALGASDR